VVIPAERGQVTCDVHGGRGVAQHVEGERAGVEGLRPEAPADLPRQNHRRLLEHIAGMAVLGADHPVVGRFPTHCVRTSPYPFPAAHRGPHGHADLPSEGINPV
jgi:hypothetical protein